jgi:ribosomal protein S18 acetylase RimI-like enzyme
VSAAPEPGSFRIEPAGLEHLAEIADLARLIWRSHYPGIISPEQIEHMLSWMYAVEVLRGELQAGVHFERLLINNVLRGFTAHSHTLDSEWLLHKLYIHPQWQRRGLAGRLLEHVGTVARNHHANGLILRVNKLNVRAIAAYERYGFTIRESVINDIGDGFVMDDYVMVKSLSSNAAPLQSST